MIANSTPMNMRTPVDMRAWATAEKRAPIFSSRFMRFFNGG
jgi:hypothetical protein